MTEGWWFAMSGLVVACAALVTTAGLLSAWPAPYRRTALGAFLALLVLYAAVGLGYALFVAPTSQAPLRDCVGPPSSSCG